MTLPIEIHESNFFVLFSALLAFYAALWGVAYAIKIAKQG